MRPWLGGTNPVTIENSVVLPAPFGPISAVMRPACAVNEAGRVAGHKLGELSERLDHQRAEERTENGADAADDGGEQRLDRNPRPVGDAGVDEQKILCVE